jgi:cytoskeletal protein CcmA (bactofilin family)
MSNKHASSASILEQHVEIVGDISFNGNLYVQGRVNGNIVAPPSSSATLYVQEGSEVIGEVRSPTVIVAGRIAGDVLASSHITLKSTASISGNIHYTELQIESGANVNGILSHMGEAET